jgi:hypothetical protein
MASMAQNEYDCFVLLFRRNWGKQSPISWQSRLALAEALKIDDRERTGLFNQFNHDKAACLTC